MMRSEAGQVEETACLGIPGNFLASDHIREC
jgi:hypothetical protein